MIRVGRRDVTALCWFASAVPMLAIWGFRLYAQSRPMTPSSTC